jgi:cell division protein FtsB
MSELGYTDEVLVRFLLGSLPEAERRRLEERFLADDQLFEQLVALEDELRYDYVDGKLGRREGERFERLLLTSPEDRARAQVARAVLDELAGRRSPSQAKVLPNAPQRPVASKLALWLSPTPRTNVALAMAAALLIVVAGALVFEILKLRSDVGRMRTLILAQQEQLNRQSGEEQLRSEQMSSELERLRRERQQLEEQVAELDAKLPAVAAPGALASTVSFLIAPGGVRGEGQSANRMLIPSTAKTVRLDLRMRRGVDYQRYRVSLLTAEGSEIWSATVSHKSAGSRRLTIELPARLLSRGDYELDLRGVTAENKFEEVDSYYISVLK